MVVDGQGGNSTYLPKDPFAPFCIKKKKRKFIIHLGKESHFPLCLFCCFQDALTLLSFNELVEHAYLWGTH